MTDEDGDDQVMPIDSSDDEAAPERVVDAPRRRLGKLPPVVPKHALRLSAYATDALAAPEVFDGSGGDLPWGDLGNTDIGDCTIAAPMHMQQAVQTVRYGRTPPFTTQDAYDYYSAWCGWVRGRDDTDQGGVISDVLAKWCGCGLKNHHLVAYGYLDPKDRDAVRHATAAYGGLVIGMAVPNSAMRSDSPDWDVAANDGGSAGGHCVYVYGYDEDYVLFISWGRKMRMTWAFWDAYVDEAWGVLLAAHLRDGHTVAGVDTRTLEADAARNLRHGGG